MQQKIRLMLTPPRKMQEIWWFLPTSEYQEEEYYKASFLQFPIKQAGNYLVKVEADDYVTKYVPLEVKKIYKRERYLTMKTIYLHTVPKKNEIELDEFVVVATKLKFYMNGDTLVYDADAFNLAEGSMLGALVSMIGLRSMTADINVTGTWALMTFMLITFHKIKANGFGGYLKSFGQPVAFILPLNIVSEVATPASMAFRLFGNVAGGMVITSLLYGALGALSKAVGLSFAAGSWGFSLFQVGIPAVLSVYFDLFSGCIQAYIFSMLTMVNVGAAAESD